jgi:branched-chain amino acid transport system permease protein
VSTEPERAAGRPVPGGPGGEAAKPVTGTAAAAGPADGQPAGSGQPGGGPQVGIDEWVARQAQRHEYLPGRLGEAQRLLGRVGWWPRLIIAGAVAAALPALGLGGFQLQVGINALILAMLALGLNVVVGWAGLLDLGYVAFFGFGAYGFALLSSAQLGSHGIHLPAYFSLPLVMAGAAILGVLVSLPSRRLIGDYLAIVTLFFGEAFVEFTNNVAPHQLGGPNGIVGIDPIQVFIHRGQSPQFQFLTNQDYFYLLVGLLVATMAVLRLLDGSRTGRALRAVREDPLAAGAMTIPVNRVKLMAFAFGAVIAALAGTVFAAQQISVFPTDFDTNYLILIYAGLILGGAGSIAGAVLGGLTLVVILDGLLRSPTDAGYLFYGLILLTLLVRLRPWRRLAAVLGGTVAFGFAAHAIVGAISPSAVAGGPQTTGWIASALRDWVIVPANPEVPGNIGFVLVICLLIALVQLKGRWRTMLMVPTIYLAACVWEGRLAVEPSITRQILLGAILIVMMNARPQGLLGTRRVEVV